MAKLVNWDWDKYSKIEDMEDMFVLSKSTTVEEPPIQEILTRYDLLNLSIESDIAASKNAFDFSEPKKTEN